MSLKWLSPVSAFSLPWRRGELIWQLAGREVEAQFKGSFLGLLWVFARPLLMLTVYTFVFGVIWPRDADGLPLGSFAMTMFCGMALYNLFSSSIGQSCGSVVGKVGFVKQVVFPLEVLPFAQTLANFLLGMAWFILLIVGIFLVYGALPWTCVLFPLILLPLFLLAMGLAWFVSSLTVYVRDMKLFIPVVLQILFFVTPIFWQLDQLKGRRAALVPYLYWNPLTGLVEAMRDVMIRGNLPDWRLLGILTAAGAGCWFLGYAWFMKTKKGFADVM